MNREETKGFSEPRGKGGREGDFDGQRTMTGTDHTDQGHGAEPQPKRLIHRFLPAHHGEMFTTITRSLEDHAEKGS